MTKISGKKNSFIYSNMTLLYIDNGYWFCSNLSLIKGIIVMECGKIHYTFNTASKYGKDGWDKQAPYLF